MEVAGLRHLYLSNPYQEATQIDSEVNNKEGIFVINHDLIQEVILIKSLYLKVPILSTFKEFPKRSSSFSILYTSLTM